MTAIPLFSLSYLILISEIVMFTLYFLASPFTLLGLNLALADPPESDDFRFSMKLWKVILN